jgi:hypothetical protein
MGTPYQATQLKPREVAAHAGRRGAKLGGQFIDGSVAVTQQYLEDTLGALISLY